jgi:septal ring factor EnvC (AmiA/AmiB activator)
MLVLGMMLCTYLEVSATNSYGSRTKDKVKEQRSKIRSAEKTIRKLEGKKLGVLESLQNLDKEILAAERQCRISQKRMDGLVREISGLKQELRDIESKIERQRHEYGRRLVVFYRAGRAGMLPLLFSKSSLPEKFRNLDAFKMILVTDRERLHAFHELLREKVRTEESLNARVGQEAELQAKIQHRKQAFEETRQAKNKVLLHIEQDEEQHTRLLEELRRALEKLETKLKEEKLQGVKTLRGTLQAQKGKLPWPVEGAVYRRFGKRVDPKYNAAMRFNGIDIRTEPGKPVKAVWGGGVVYADWFRGYGKLLIIHHGKKDYTIMSHLSQLTKHKGERVEAGEVVGMAGETGSVDGCVVHFEVWHGGKARNPLDWLKR